MNPFGKHQLACQPACLLFPIPYSLFTISGRKLIIMTPPLAFLPPSIPIPIPNSPFPRTATFQIHPSILTLPALDVCTYLGSLPKKKKKKKRDVFTCRASWSDRQTGSRWGRCCCCAGLWLWCAEGGVLVVEGERGGAEGGWTGGGLVECAGGWGMLCVGGFFF